MRQPLLAVLLVAASPAVASATTYEVGPGQAYTTLGAVPWASLAPGDTVRVHAQSSPYKEKFIVNAAGTASAPITITGVPDAQGNLPILDGDGAVEAPNEQGYQDDDRFVIKVGDASAPSNPAGAAYLTIEKLHIRNAYPSYTFSSNRLGNNVSYAKNAAGIWLQHGAHLTIRGCEIEHNADGIFAAYGASNPVSDVLIEGNYLHDNGVAGDAYEHNSYVQVDGVVYQFNHYGPPLSTSGANNLKDRSSKMVARYNWLEGGERVMDLVDNSNFTADPAYFTAYVYGNVLVKTSSAGNNAIIHFGGDSGTTSQYRTTLWLWNNDIISQRSGNCTLLQLDTASQTVNLLNDIVTAQQGFTIPAVSGGSGTLNKSGDWIASGSNLDPGFVSLANLDLHLAAGAAVIDTAAALPSDLAAYPLDQEYLAPQSSAPRPQDGALDVGAYEYGTAPSSSGSTSGTTGSSSGSTSGSTSAGSTTGGSTTGGATGTGSTTTGGSTTSGSTSGAGSTSGSSGSGSSGGATPGGAPEAKGGCGCSETGGIDLGLLALGALALARRKRGG